MLENVERQFQQFQKDPDRAKAALAGLLLNGLAAWRRLYGEPTDNPDIHNVESSTSPSRITVEGLGKAKALIENGMFRRDLELPGDNDKNRYLYLHQKHPSDLIKSYNGKTIKDLRLRARLSQRDLGRYVGRSQALISEIEKENGNEKSSIHWDVVLRIAYLFGQDVSAIVSDPTEIDLIKQRTKELLSK